MSVRFQNSMKSGRILFVQLLCVVLLSSPRKAAVTNNIIQNFHWDGVNAYLRVDRHRIQNKLDDWYDSNKDKCHAPKLYLPETPVFPELLDKNHHVMYIDVGQANFNDFKDYPDKCISESVNGLEFDVVIPLLTDDPKGNPKYSLALSKFYQRDRGDFPRPNLVFPYIPVDELAMNDTTAVMRIGDDELRLSFQRFIDPCLSPLPLIRHEFDKFVNQDFHFGIPEPNFSFCDTHPSDSHYCLTAGKIIDQVLSASPNICESSWNSADRVSCMTSLKVENITDGFRDFLLIGDGPLQIVSSESIVGNFTSGLKYPCM